MRSDPMSETRRAKFTLGQVVATPGALEAIRDAGQSPADFLSRHVSGDWGDLCDDDRRLNNLALTDGSRLLSAYQTLRGERLWIITEAANNSGHRSSTTILRPEEY
jgi:hypothetical protein